MILLWPLRDDANCNPEVGVAVLYCYVSLRLADVIILSFIKGFISSLHHIPYRILVARKPTS